MHLHDRYTLPDDNQQVVDAGWFDSQFLTMVFAKIRDFEPMARQGNSSAESLPRWWSQCGGDSLRNHPSNFYLASPISRDLLRRYRHPHQDVAPHYFSIHGMAIFSHAQLVCATRCVRQLI